jgi:5-(carboxyamino)imidazole ribonucleotide synthase
MHETHDREVLSPRQPLRPPRLGIIGGGQLAKMTALAALQLGCDVVVLERNRDSPATRWSTHAIVGNWDDPAAVLALAAQVDVVSIENEFIAVEALEAVERSGGRLFPSTATLRKIQDKLIQKQTLAAAGLDVPRFAGVGSREEVAEFAREAGWPVVLKARRNGYDGKGNATVRGESGCAAAWTALGGDHQALYVEAFCPYVAELATIVTRGRDGSVVAYPVVETVQCDHICHRVRAPAAVSGAIARRAAACALRAIEAIDGVGSFGVEMFLTGEGEVLVNELAPRVHNSGHYTIEGCVCSQFENHVRAVLGWPLGSAAMVAPAAVMINLLGVGPGPGSPLGMPEALAVPGAHLHIYGKAMSGAGRKMGHVTALGRSREEAEAAAQRAAGALRFGANL